MLNKYKLYVIPNLIVLIFLLFFLFFDPDHIISSTITDLAMPLDLLILNREFTYQDIYCYVFFLF